MDNNGDVQPKDFKVGGSGAHSILIVCSLLYMVNYMDRQVLSVVLQEMSSDLKFTDTQAGALQTIFFISMAMFSFPAAYMLDRWSRRKAIAIMATVWSLFTFVTGLGKSFLGVAFPRIFVGIGEAGFAAGGTAMIGASYPIESRSRAMGIFNIAIPLGSGLGMILGGMLSEHFSDWRAPFFIFAIPGLLLGISALFLKDYKTVIEVDESGQQIGFFQSAFSLFKIPTLKWVYLGFAMQNIMAFSFLAWAPSFIQRAQGLEEDKAGLVAGTIALMAIIGAPLGGFIADYWHSKNPRGRLYTPVVGLIISSITFVIALLFDFKGFGFAIAFVFGITLVMGVPALSAVTQDVVRPGLKSVSWGMNVFCMFMLGGGWAPYLVGRVSDALGGDADSLRTALMFTAIGGILAAILFFIASKHYAEDAEKVRHLTLECE